MVDDFCELPSWREHSGLIDRLGLVGSQSETSVANSNSEKILGCYSSCKEYLFNIWTLSKNKTTLGDTIEIVKYLLAGSPKNTSNIDTVHNEEKN